MNSGQKSSGQDPTHPVDADLESLAGLFHPHAIEVQEFSFYALIVDLRSLAEFEDDHLPGAVCVPPAVLVSSEGAVGRRSELLARDSAGPIDLPPALAARVSEIRLDQAILVYDGRGGFDSGPVARALRWRGWTVDVLPGGWINYRRWVQAGLEVVPRAIAFQVIATGLASESARVLAGLVNAGQQVLDVATLAGWRPDALTTRATASAASSPPTQGLFESRLLQALRQFDPRQPVWMAQAPRYLGQLVLPPALAEALAVAPLATLVCPLAERIARWREDEPLLDGPVAAIVQAVMAAWPGAATGWLAAKADWPDADDLLGGLLADRDAAMLNGQGAQGRPTLPVVATASLGPDGLRQAILAWLPLVTLVDRD